MEDLPLFVSIPCRQYHHTNFDSTVAIFATDKDWCYAGNPEHPWGPFVQGVIFLIELCCMAFSLYACHIKRQSSFRNGHDEELGAVWCICRVCAPSYHRLPPAVEAVEEKDLLLREEVAETCNEREPEVLVLDPGSHKTERTLRRY